MDYKQLDTADYINLSEAVGEVIKNYLKSVNTKHINNLYELVIEQIEPPLLQATMEKEKYNQSRTAKTLGLSRGTTRAKLKKHFGDKYCGTNDEL